MKHHKFHTLHVKMHKDGSHTSHLEHEDGPQHDVHAGHGDHDSMVDHIMSHTSAPNMGEAAADMGDHGVPSEHAMPAGLPPAPPAAPGA
jgi:hypothetical protein